MARDGDDLLLVVRRVFHADAEFLFDAWTDPKHVARWFHSKEGWTTEVVKADLRPGGAWEIVMHDAAGPTCRSFGTYRLIERPRRLVFTWFPYDDPGYETVVTLELTPLTADTTELTLTQTGLRQRKDWTEHQGGWDGCLNSLKQFVDRYR
jgi:uncharacterized protein YndB with AHSA1/START domain